MSGIAAVMDAAAPRPALEAVVARLAGHGAVPECLVVGPEIALGKARLGRLPGDGPLWRGDDGIIVALDGEIYHDTGVEPDPAAVVADHYRADTLDRLAWLNGSFAAIIVDTRTSCVVLATDRHASVALFVWRSGSQLAAASRLGALVADRRVPRRLSVQGVSELLNYQRTIGSQTQYADIEAMPAAQVWRFDDGRWTDSTTRRLAWTPGGGTERDCAERLATGLQKAVARRTADDVRHGLLLSGGLDARWVLAGARAAGRTLPCTTFATHDNAEVRIARQSARRAGMPHAYVENPPASLAASLDGATDASDGLFTAPLNLYGLLPGLAADHDVLLSGHGLDYTVRGYYLPCATLRLAGSNTRMPRLRAVADGSAETVSAALRVGIDPATMRRVLAADLAADFEKRRVVAMRRALDAAEIDDAYDAWDAFLLHALGRHYAYSDFVAMRGFVAHRTPTFDPDFFDAYLSMPPAWRASGRAAYAAMRQLGAGLMQLPDANTGFPARLSPWTHIALLLARAAGRRAGFFRPARLADPVWTHGSWANYHELLRRDAAFVACIKALPTSSALRDTGLFDGDGLRAVVDEHLAARASHRKLLLQLLTLDSWLGQHGYTEVVHDA